MEDAFDDTFDDVEEEEEVFEEDGEELDEDGMNDGVEEDEGRSERKDREELRSDTDESCSCEFISDCLVEVNSEDEDDDEEEAELASSSVDGVRSSGVSACSCESKRFWVNRWKRAAVSAFSVALPFGGSSKRDFFSSLFILSACANVIPSSSTVPTFAGLSVILLIPSKKSSSFSGCLNKLNSEALPSSLSISVSSIELTCSLLLLTTPPPLVVVRSWSSN